MDLSSNMAPRVLDGRLALVTGAGQGNGRAIAIGLARARTRVVVTDINAEPVQQTETAIRAAGGEAWAHVLDVTSREACVALAKDGVRVNAVAPGVIETLMTVHTRGSPEILQKFMARTPMGRVGQPEELVGPVVFLASDMASYVTGVTLPVDGGFLAA